MEYLEELERLRQPTPADDFVRLSRRLSTHLTALEEQQFEHESLDIDLARLVTDRLTRLAGEAAELTPEQRGWLRGAIDYFLITTDIENDVLSPEGLVDDARVLNHALERIGRTDLLVDVSGR
jgi:hypothetical protein